MLRILTFFLGAEMMINGSCRILGQDPFQLRQGCIVDGGQGFELPQQFLLSLWADAGNAVQLRIPQARAAQLAVIGNGEPVGLLLDIAEGCGSSGISPLPSKGRKQK